MIMEADAELAERMCIVTRKVMDEAELIRFVRSPAGEAVPDLARKLPGRGVWVQLSRAKVAEAVKRNLFSRGFSEATRAAPELPETIGKMLRQSALSYMSLAKKAGEAVAGFGKVEDLLGKGATRVLIHAAEAAADGCRKLDGMAAPEVEKIGLFHVDELDLAFGRSNVIHAALTKGGLAERLLAAVRRLKIYDAQPGATLSEERA